MITDLQTASRRGQRLGARLAAAGAVATAALAWNGLSDLRQSIPFVVFACLAPAIGCLFFTLIHRATGGQWARGLRPFLRAGTALAPWIWLASLPSLLLARATAFDAVLHGWGYEALPWLALRGLAVAAVLFWLAWACGLEAGDDRQATRNRHSWVGPVGFIVLVFTLTFVADDWIESGQPGWHSTAFPVVWMASQCLSGLAVCVFAAVATGSDPRERGMADRPLGNDWGNLLLATLFFWSYVSFGEFLIIWSGNMPDEISWFLARERGGWIVVAPLLVTANFLLPFVCLLSRKFKERRNALLGLTAVLVAGQILYAAWLTLPTGAPFSPVGTALSITLLVTGLGAVVHESCRRLRCLDGGGR